MRWTVGGGWITMRRMAKNEVPWIVKAEVIHKMYEEFGREPYHKKDRTTAKELARRFGVTPGNFSIYRTLGRNLNHIPTLLEMPSYQEAYRYYLKVDSQSKQRESIGRTEN